MKKTKLIILAVLSTILISYCYAKQEDSSIVNIDRLKKVDTVIEKSIKNGETPGAVILIVNKNKIIYEKAFGNKQTWRKKVPMLTNTIFDLASCTKPVATGTSIMLLLERGQIRLSDNVSLYIPDFEPFKDTIKKVKKEIKIIDLLTHSSGLPSYITATELKKNYGYPTPDSLISYIAHCYRDFEPSTQFQYSCLNFIILQRVVECVTKMKLSDFALENIFQPLGMTDTRYNPTKVLIERSAPTQVEADSVMLQGIVHDPLAKIMNGNSGNAGLFSTAQDLAKYCMMILNRGEYCGVRILSPLTVQKFLTVPRGYEKIGRALSWDNYSDYSSNKGELFGNHSVCHSGYTGTSIVIEPETNIAVILLTNRVHPFDKTKISRLCSSVANIVASSIIK